VRRLRSVIHLTLPLACGLLVARATGAQAQEAGRALPGPVEARELPAGTEAGALPEPVEADDLPSGASADRPGPRGARPARPVPEGVEPRPGPIDPPPVRPEPARGALLPAPMDEPLAEDADRNPGFWQARRQAAEANLARIRSERRTTEDAFTQACRFKGGDRCDVLRENAWALHRQEVALEGYLEEGLREECRRAGCLPGWVRD